MPSWLTEALLADGQAVCIVGASACIRGISMHMRTLSADRHLQACADTPCNQRQWSGAGLLWHPC